MRGIMVNLNMSVHFVLSKGKIIHIQRLNVKLNLEVRTGIRTLVNRICLHHLDQ